MFKQEDSPEAPLTILLEPQQSSSTLTANAKTFKAKFSMKISPCFP